MKKFLFLLACAMASLTASAQDIIVKKDGSTIQAKVLKITSTEVEYKKFSNQDGPTYTIIISELLSINYENGEKDTFGKAETKQNKRGNASPQKLEQLTENPNVKIEEEGEGEERKDMFLKLHYTGSFDNFDKGSYGIQWEFLSFKVKDKFRMGLNTGLTVNYGIVKKQYASLSFEVGPSLGYFFSNTVHCSLSVDYLMVSGLGDYGGVSHNIMVSPTINYNNKFGLFAGPVFTLNVKNASNINCGARLGFCF